MINFLSVMVQSKMYLWMSQGYTLKFIYNMAHFNSIALKKISSGWYIIEKIFYADGGAIGVSTRFLIYNFRTFNLYHTAKFIFMSFSFDFDLGNCRNRSHCLASESHCTNGKQVFSLSYFR